MNIARIPLVFPALGVLGGIILVEYLPLFDLSEGGISLLFFALALFIEESVRRYFSLRQALISVLFFLLASLISSTNNRFYSRHQDNILAEKYISFTGSPIHITPRYAIVEGNANITLSTPRTIPVTLLVKTKNSQVLTLGQSYHIQGACSFPSTPLNPGAFPRHTWLTRQHIVAELMPEIINHQGKGSLKSQLFALSDQGRHFFATHMREYSAGNKEAMNVILALVLGDKEQSTPEMMHLFKQSGLLHIFAISGLHVGLVAGCASALLFALRLPPRIFALSLALIIIFYTFITGMSVSALRAGTILILWLWGMAIYRASSSINRLACAAIIIMLWDTQAPFQLGTQLTFCVFLAVILSIECRYALYPITQLDPFIPPAFYTKTEKIRVWSGQHLLSLCFISFGAWVVASLILTPHIYYFTPYAPWVNALLSFPVTILMALGLLFALCSGIPFLAFINVALAYIAEKLAQFIIITAQFSTTLPFAQTPYTLPPPSEQVSIYAVGEHYAAALGKPAIILETGDTYNAQWNLAPALFAQGFRPRYWTYSHTHAPSFRGATTLLTYYPSLALLPEPVPYSSSKNLSPKGELFTLPLPHNNRSGNADENCRLFLWQYQDKKILFMGDAGYISENALLTHYPYLRPDIIVLGAHSTDYSGTLNFLLTLRPQIIIYTQKRTMPNRPQDWEKTLRKNNIILWNLSTQGAINIFLKNTPVSYAPAR